MPKVQLTIRKPDWPRILKELKQGNIKIYDLDHLESWIESLDADWERLQSVNKMLEKELDEWKQLAESTVEKWQDSMIEMNAAILKFMKAKNESG